MYAQIWEEALRNAGDWKSLMSVTAIGWDAHQYQRRNMEIDPRTEPLYRSVRHVIAQKMRELDASKAPRDDIRYIMAILHSGPYEIKKGTCKERVRTGWGPFKRTKEEGREYEYKVLRPLEELIRELETS